MVKLTKSTVLASMNEKGPREIKLKMQHRMGCMVQMVKAILRSKVGFFRKERADRVDNVHSTMTQRSALKSQSWL